MKKLIPVLLIIAIIVTGIVFILFQPDGQTKITNVLKKGSCAINDESTSKIMSLVSQEYKDTFGLTYEALRSIFIRTFYQIDSLNVRYSIIKINLNNNLATVIIDINVTGVLTGGKQDIVGNSNNPERLTLTFTKKRFKWSIIESKWQNHQFLENVFGIPVPSNF